MSEPRTIAVAARPALWDPANPVPAGAIHDYLTTAQGIAAVESVAVAGDGTVSVLLTDVAAAPAVLAALDSLDPTSDAALEPEERSFNTLVADIEAKQADVQLIPASERTAGDKLALACSKLLLRLNKRIAP